MMETLILTRVITGALGAPGAEPAAATPERDQIGRRDRVETDIFAGDRHATAGHHVGLGEFYECSCHFLNSSLVDAPLQRPHSPLDPARFRGAIRPR